MMCGMALPTRQVKKELKEGGFHPKRNCGGHLILEGFVDKERTCVVIPDGKKEISDGMVSSLRKNTGINLGRKK